LRLQCQAEYGAVRKFLAQLDGLRWSVTPVAFRVEQANLPAATGDTEDDVAGAATADAPRVAGPTGSGEAVLRLTIVLAL
jgi:hypothetical protein